MKKLIILTVALFLLGWGCSGLSPSQPTSKVISFSYGEDTIDLVVPIHMPNIFDESIWMVTNMYPMSETLIGVDYAGKNEYLDPSYALMFDTDKQEFVVILEDFMNEGRKVYYLYDDDGEPYVASLEEVRVFLWGEEEAIPEIEDREA